MAEIAAAVVRRPDGCVLLLRRAAGRRRYPGRWCVVTGLVEPGESPRAAAIRELREELGLTAEPQRGGAVVTVESEDGEVLRVHPFLFDFDHDPPLALEAEHDAFRWVRPAEVEGYETVPKLADDLRVLGLL